MITIGRLLASGSSGTVFTILNQPFVIKISLDTQTAAQEISVLKSISKKNDGATNVPKVIDYGMLVLENLGKEYKS